MNTITKAQKELPEFCDEVAGLSVDQLNARLAQNAKDYSEVNKVKEADQGLSDAREAAKLANAPYVDAKKSLRLKSEYLIQLIKDKGGL